MVAMLFYKCDYRLETEFVVTMKKTDNCGLDAFAQAEMRLTSTTWKLCGEFKSKWTLLALL